jgi:hypothetical protein
MKELSKDDLFRYLKSVQKAAALQNTDIEPSKITEEQWAEFCMREGASRLAAELVKRYGLDIPEN